MVLQAKHINVYLYNLFSEYQIVQEILAIYKNKLKELKELLLAYTMNKPIV